MRKNGIFRTIALCSNCVCLCASVHSINYVNFTSLAVFRFGESLIECVKRRKKYVFRYDRTCYWAASNADEYMSEANPRIECASHIKQICPRPICQFGFGFWIFASFERGVAQTWFLKLILPFIAHYVRITWFIRLNVFFSSASCAYHISTRWHLLGPEKMRAK